MSRIAELKAVRSSCRAGLVNSDSRGRRPVAYLRLALVQASGQDGLVRDDHPVGQAVQLVPELGVALQVGLHLADSVQQVVGDLRRERGVSVAGRWSRGRSREEVTLTLLQQRLMALSLPTCCSRLGGLTLGLDRICGACLLSQPSRSFWALVSSARAWKDARNADAVRPHVYTKQKIHRNPLTEHVFKNASQAG